MDLPLASSLSMPSWSCEVNTHCSQITHAIKECLASGVSRTKPAPRKKSMSDSTWSLVLEKKTLVKRYFWTLSAAKTSQLRFWFALWRSSSSVVAVLAYLTLLSLFCPLPRNLSGKLCGSGINSDSWVFRFVLQPGVMIATSWMSWLLILAAVTVLKVSNAFGNASASSSPAIVARSAKLNWTSQSLSLSISKHWKLELPTALCFSTGCPAKRPSAP